MIDVDQIDVYTFSMELPIGLHVTRTAKTLSRAFDDALVAAGGSTPTWLVLLALKTNQATTQRALAEHLGIRQPTLVHHLNGLERSGLIERRAHPDDRRAQRLVLTAAGEDLFVQLRDAAVRFDRRLRRGVDADQLEEVRRVLDALADNAVRR